MKGELAPHMVLVFLGAVYLLAGAFSGGVGIGLMRSIVIEHTM